MRAKHLLVPAVALCFVGVGFTEAAEAHGKTRTTVTIKAQGTDLAGKVESRKPSWCSEGRVVYLMLQVGKRGGGNDEVYASDTASWSDGAYRWDTGNLGHEGKFYAVVLPTSKCKGDKSPTVRARNPVT